jgi:hypothetical protein
MISDDNSFMGMIWIKVLFPNLDGLVPNQMKVIWSLQKKIYTCEGGIPFEFWCKNCVNKYMRALELIARWRKMGKYFWHGQWWCNHVPITEYDIDVAFYRAEYFVNDTMRKPWFGTDLSA